MVHGGMVKKDDEFPALLSQDGEAWHGGSSQTMAPWHPGVRAHGVLVPGALTIIGRHAPEAACCFFHPPVCPTDHPIEDLSRAFIALHLNSASAVSDEPLAFARVVHVDPRLILSLNFLSRGFSPGIGPIL